MGERDFPIRMSSKASMSSSLSRTIALLGNVSVGTTTPDEADKAAWALAGGARDAAELREWLQMCGLLPYDCKPRTSFVPHGRVITAYRRP